MRLDHRLGWLSWNTNPIHGQRGTILSAQVFDLAVTIGWINLLLTGFSVVAWPPYFPLSTHSTLSQGFDYSQLSLSGSLNPDTKPLHERAQYCPALFPTPLTWPVLKTEGLLMTSWKRWHSLSLCILMLPSLSLLIHLASFYPKFKSLS